MTGLDVMVSCRRHGRDILRLEEQIDDLRALAEGVRSPGTGSGGSGGEDDRMAAYAVRLDELESRLRRVRADQGGEKAAIILLTDGLERKLRKCARYFYCDGLSAEMIAREMSYTPSYVYGFLRQVRALAKTIGDEETAAVLPPWYGRDEGNG